jgi:hypothetical protein
MPQDQDQPSVIWPQDMQDEAMHMGGEDDFSKFLDLDNDFDFTSLDNGPSGIDTPMGRLAFGHTNGQPPTTQSTAYAAHPQMSVAMTSNGDQNNFANNITSAQQYEAFQQQYHQMHMAHQYQVPPTPVSSEMNPGKYNQHVDAIGQIMFDRQQMSFTPLVSPAQTPLTHAYSVPQYGTADDFFSPLTSPAIEAQQAFSSTRTTASPIDLNSINAETASSKPTSAPRTRRRKNSTSATSRTGTRSVKQSPLVKAQTRRRKPSLTNLSTDKLNAILQHASDGQVTPTTRGTARALPGHVLNNAAKSSDDSVSPEPLSEALMRPPPVPQAEKSPMILGMPRESSPENGVTPSTLMTLPNKSSAAASVAVGPAIPEDSMEDIMLPGPGIQEQEVAQASNLDHVPVTSSKVPKISAGSTPRSLMPRNKVENRPGTSRGGKKRGNTASASISPALRPKISPSISPLVPATGEWLHRPLLASPNGTGSGVPHLSAETSALYLASKSNYQNILDGTHLPGVSYPEALAENLSSKRTSHKIAEQGRRNRINLALKEIESLLPPTLTHPTVKKEKSSDGETSKETSNKAAAAAAAAANNQGASKANTVEMAIVYIKSLQGELAEAKDKLTAAEKRLAETNSSNVSQASAE